MPERPGKGAERSRVYEADRMRVHASEKGAPRVRNASGHVRGDGAGHRNPTEMKERKPVGNENTAGNRSSKPGMRHTEMSGGRRRPSSDQIRRRSAEMGGRDAGRTDGRTRMSQGSGQRTGKRSRTGRSFGGRRPGWNGSPFDLKKILIAAGALITVLVIVYCVIGMGYKKKFLPNTYVNGFNVSGYSVEETEAVLKASVETYKLEIAFRGGKSEVITSSDMGLTYVSSNEVESLVAGQSVMGWLANMLGKHNYYNVSTSFQYDNAQMRAYLESMPEFSSEYVTEPKNSTIVMDSDLTFRTSTEFQGNQLNKEMVFSAVDEAINSSAGRLSLEKVEGAYVSPSVTSENEELQERVEKLNSYLETNLTLVYRDGTTDVIDRERLAGWAKKDDDGLYDLDDDNVYMNIYAIVEAAAEKYNDVHNYLDFNSTNNGVVRLECSSPYGYKINVDSQTDAIFSLVYSHTVGEYEFENAVSASAADKIGDTYVEVDVTNQHVYYYKEGSLFMDTPCVTGLESDPERRTPSGVYAIFDLAEDQTLGDVEITGYSSFVDYWMPFYESYGLHDASWRSDFSSDMYLEYGSHGCVNLPVEEARKLFINLEIWTPVIVCRESDAASTSSHTLDE